MKNTILFLAALAMTAWFACGREQPAQSPVQQTQQTTAESDSAKLDAMAARFAPVDLSADVAALPPNERQALTKLIQASQVFDALFLRQVWAGNEAMLLDLVRDGSPAG